MFGMKTETNQATHYLETVSCIYLILTFDLLSTLVN